MGWERGHEGADLRSDGSSKDPSRLELLVRHRFWIQGMVDALAWFPALLGATILRFEFELARVDVSRLLLLAAIAAFAQFSVGVASGLYLGRWSYGSFEEVAALARATAAALAISLIVNQFPRLVLVPTAAIIIATVLVMGMQTSIRYLWRLLLERRQRPKGDDLHRVVVVGAGSGGQQLVRAMLASRDSPYLPVALLDDDPARRRLTIKGIAVEGRTSDVCRVADARDATAVVIAIPSAEGSFVRGIVDDARACDLEVFILPPVGDLLSGSVGVSDVRPVAEADLLGRRVLDTDVEAIAEYLTNRRVLVTGAGGSIGAEMCRQIDRFGPDSLIMVDRDESALHELQLSIEGRALLDDDTIVVADIRDEQRMADVFAHHRPQVVFHAAALKHLPLLELHPDEGVKTNVVGTHNVLTAAAGVGVERFVNISTDKAAAPTSVLGHTKALAEQLTARFDDAHPGRYVSVRFGNVLGSRGSVLGAFHTQIEAGGPVTVTHPDVTRYFMLVEEAVQLVIQAGSLDVPGGVALVLDMGEPVSIKKMAEELIREQNRPVKIVYTGLRPGEKLHEDLLSGQETATATDHEMITMVTVRTVDAGARVESLRESGCDAHVLSELAGHGPLGGWPSTA